MPSREWKSGPAFREVMAELSSLEERMLSHPNAPSDEQFAVETYKWILSIAQVAFDCFVWADSGRPRFVDIVGPYKKWGGDNVDAFYQYAPIDPRRAYRVRGTAGDAAYFSLTVYGGPDDGRYSERIVGAVNSRELDVDEQGRFSFWISPYRQEGPGILLDSDAVAAISRDYLANPKTDARATWVIEADEPARRWRESDADLERRLMAALTWIRERDGPALSGADNNLRLGGR
jgi:hypothetical protein